MRFLIKILLALSIAFIVYATIGFVSRGIIHYFLLPNNLLDINYYDTFSSIIIILLGTMISVKQFSRLQVLQISFSLWMLLLYWVVTAFPFVLLFSADISSDIYLYYFLNNLVYNLWSGTSAFITHQGLEILYVLLVVIITQQIAKYALSQQVEKLSNSEKLNT